jgi:hypothetical protein
MRAEPFKNRLRHDMTQCYYRGHAHFSGTVDNHEPCVAGRCAVCGMWIEVGAGTNRPYGARTVTVCEPPCDAAAAWNSAWDAPGPRRSSRAAAYRADG